MRLRNLRIGQRLALVMGGVLVLMAGVAGCGVWGLSRLHDMADYALQHETALAQRATALQVLVLEERRFEKDTFINLSDAARRDDYARRWAASGERLQTAMDSIAQLAQDDDARDIASLRDSFKVYASGFQSVLEDMRHGRVATTLEANVAMGQFKEAVQGMEKLTDAIAQRAGERAGKVEDMIEDTLLRAVALQLTLAGAALLLAGLSCWLVSRSVTRPIRAAVELARSVADGDLRARIGATTRDETGQLLTALGHMNDSLAGIVSRVRAGSDSIATGSAQIAIGNADLSQRTEEQASNLQQTAASMEQLTATVKQNAETARAATQFASSASQAAGRGGDVVGQVVSTMDQISASSRRIADIIGVIDGIAFQTNILALNAAVEAARAGESGRGFAVVAAEVRSLAQRSAQAAKEIKGLIGESVERVDAGSSLVNRAGVAMREIVEEIRRVSDLIGEISAASLEQSSGIGQIGDAVTQLDQVTQQNAALVEESAAAAESLKHQARQLADVVAVFRLADDAPAPRPPAAGVATGATETASVTEGAGGARRSGVEARKAEVATADGPWRAF